MKIDVTKLDIALANAKMSIAALSENSKVSRIAIARYRGGSQEARPQNVGKIAEALGVKVEDLLQEEK